MLQTNKEIKISALDYIPITAIPQGELLGLASPPGQSLILIAHHSQLFDFLKN